MNIMSFLFLLTFSTPTGVINISFNAFVFKNNIKKSYVAILEFESGKCYIFFVVAYCATFTNPSPSPL